MIKYLSLVLLSNVLFLPSCDALTVDWSVLNWPDGSESNSYTLGTSPSDGTVTFTIDEGNANSSYSANSYIGAVPGDNTSVTLSGGTPGEESLVIAANHVTSAGFIDITISFDVPVYGVFFYIYDVDTWEGEWRDLVYDFTSENDGTSTGGPTLTPNGTDNQSTTFNGTTAVIGRNPPGGVGGDDDDIFNANPNESGGNVFVDYGSTVITELNFKWKNQDSAQNNQYIGIGATFFTVVPEASSILALLPLLAFAGSRRFRKR
ncbi:MAG: hypothetical protein AAF571_02645 [Verrucomicrobiota bacterium]